VAAVGAVVVNKVVVVVEESATAATSDAASLPLPVAANEDMVTFL
jgi:hypothetical protein